MGEHLAADGLMGELLIVGGAYMTLVLRQREATKDVDDVDAYFAANAEGIRAAAARVARDDALSADWLNDAVKGFFYVQPEAMPWAELPGLRVYAPGADYIFAMKAVAGRPEDLRDLEALRETLTLTSVGEALSLLTR